MSAATLRHWRLQPSYQRRDAWWPAPHITHRPKYMKQRYGGFHHWLLSSRFSSLFVSISSLFTSTHVATEQNSRSADQLWSRWSDLWSLGLVLVEICTLRDAWFDYCLERARTADEVVANVADPNATNFDLGLPNDVPGMSECCIRLPVIVSRLVTHVCVISTRFPCDGRSIAYRDSHVYAAQSNGARSSGRHCAHPRGGCAGGTRIFLDYCHQDDCVCC